MEFRRVLFRSPRTDCCEAGGARRRRLSTSFFSGRIPCASIVTTPGWRRCGTRMLRIHRCRTACFKHTPQENHEESIDHGSHGPRRLLSGRAAAGEGLRGAWHQAPCVIVQYPRSEEHTSELQSLMRISYAVFCLKKKKKTPMNNITPLHHQT